MLADLKPSILELEDEKIGYFYTPQQLQAIRDKNDLELNHFEYIEQIKHHSNIYNRLRNMIRK